MGLGDGGWEGDGCGYKKATGMILVVIELFSVLTMVVYIGTTHVTKLCGENKHTHKLMQTELSKLGELGQYENLS